LKRWLPVQLPDVVWQVFMVLYLKQLVLSDNNLIRISHFIGNPRMHGLMQVCIFG
jgi:hypothetical protein